MNTMELNVVMMRKGATSKQLADVIQKSRVSFDKKRFGHVPFDVNEIKALTSALSLTYEQVDAIFFDGDLHDGNKSTSAMT